MAFLLLGIGYLQNDGAHPQGQCIIAGGAFGLMAAFLAWYNALAGIADSSNRSVFFNISLMSPCANAPQLLRHPRCPLPLV
jgi:succinate-acetate transporter protein